jgi:hypothetical protein
MNTPTAEGNRCKDPIAPRGLGASTTEERFQWKKFRLMNFYIRAPFGVGLGPDPGPSRGMLQLCGCFGCPLRPTLNSQLRTGRELKVLEIVNREPLGRLAFLTARRINVEVCARASERVAIHCHRAGARRAH